MKAEPKASSKLWLGGFIYGLLLTGVGALMAGAGHGTYLLLGVASAPLSYLGVIVSLVSPPILWSAIWGLIPHTYKSPQRQIFVVALALHYLAIPLIPFFKVYSEEKYLVKALEVNPVVVVLGTALYLLGQVIIWLYWFRMGAKIKLS